jgi:hypothetical protein
MDDDAPEGVLGVFDGAFQVKLVGLELHLAKSVVDSPGAMEVLEALSEQLGMVGCWLSHPKSV